MTVPAIQNSFVSGELSPQMLGRQDVARYHTGCSTMRNVYPSYRGPAVSRPGTAFCGFSAQTGKTYPPRLVPFQFSVNQGRVLEFGDFYMRVLYNGAYITEPPATITGVTTSATTFISTSTNTATAATANNGAVYSSYNGGDLITLAGGTYATPAVLIVTSTQLLSCSPANTGFGYAPTNTITLTGGTISVSPVVTVATTLVINAAVNAGGTGGTNGTQTVTGTTGTGTKFQASVTVAGGAITGVLSVTSGGAYTVNPTSLVSEPVTGAGLTGATLTVAMGVRTATVTTAGTVTANAPFMTQASTSGSGTGVIFGGLIFGIRALTVSVGGSYVVAPSNPVSQASTTGSGAGATFTTTFGTGPAYANSQWVYLTGIVGPSFLNGQTVVVSGSTGSGFYANDVYGNPISTLGQPAYVSGGQSARIYTLGTQYAQADLLWMKFQESADTLSICCVNQQSGTEYPPLDLTRVSDTNWVFTSVAPAPSITPPTSALASSSAVGSTYYGYEVTAIASDGTESIASPIASVSNAVDIAATAGSITVTWNAVSNAIVYYVYKASPSYSTPVPVGATYGFAGQALGTQLVDSNIVPDYAQVPPQHQSPFARGQIIGATAQAGGINYTTATAVISTSTGTGAVLQAVIVSKAVAAWIIVDPGQNYASSDTATVSGDGTGAALLLQVGPSSGTYPGCVSYFQQRRVYANSLNSTDTYWMSQPGAYQNFDVRNPTIASDAITGSPWSVEVNGIQFMMQTSGGLLVMTGLSAWLLVGAGSFATNVQPISPSSQDNVPQAFSGCSPFIQPVKINYDILYVNQKGSYYYDLPYQLYALSEPIDLTEISSHLFANYTIKSHAWCEQPDKLLWAIRSDGVMLSLTYYKTQQISGWARHDTNGAFVSNCSITELPIDALYVATQRFVGTAKQCYMVERMSSRSWTNVEQAWCVDAGLQLPQPTPAATLSLSSAAGAGSINGYTNLVGGSGYSAATQFSCVDTNGGTGSGATVTGTIVGGVVTALSATGGSNYQFPVFVVTDPAGSAGGSGFSASPILSNTATFSTSAAVFSSGSVGSYIRAGGGIAIITTYTDSQNVTVNILNPFPTVPNSGGTPQTFYTGSWTLTAPVTTVGGLSHLIGQTVTGLADGNVITPQTVSATGTITLPTAASAVVVGLGFKAQMQSVPFDMGQPTVQGQRKIIAALTARLENSLGVDATANQVDGAVLSPPIINPVWNNEIVLPDTGPGAPDYAIKPYNALAQPLWTGDRRAPLLGGLSRRGQLALVQNKPLPMTVLSIMPEFLPGDAPGVNWPQKKPQK